MDAPSEPSGGDAARGGRAGRGRNRNRNRNRNRRGRGGGGGNAGEAPAPVPENGAAGDVEMTDAGRAAPAAPVAAAVPAAAVVLPHADARTSSTTRGEMTATPFAALPIADVLKRAVREVLGYEFATAVQARSVPVSAAGADVLVKARTGTGKTLAFLLPAISRVLQRPGGAGVKILVVSPTRELAQQIVEEARMVTRFASGFSLMCVYGGSNIRADVSAFKRGMPTLLVATPGRLLDHMSNLQVGLLRAMEGLQTLVLDEADRLLDMGFRNDLEKILSGLPPVQKRCTMLFSATMPSDVKTITRIALKDAHEVVDCVGEDANTHERVPQQVLVTPFDQQIAALAYVLQQFMTAPRYKVIVFFTTARLTQFFSELFSQGMGIRVLEMHSRKSQGHRNKMSEQFRNNHSLIMFSSDVTARGLDFPDVSGVIQVGRPVDREQYIHRLGRTARAGKNGSGVLILSDFEAASFQRCVKDLPITAYETPDPVMMQGLQQRGLEACRYLPELTKSLAYQASMGFYNSHLKSLGWNKADLVACFNQWITEAIGQQEVPMLEARTVGKMGLSGVPGVRVSRGGGGVRGGSRGGNRGNGSRGDGISKQDFRGGGGFGGRGRGRGRGRGGRGMSSM